MPTHSKHSFFRHKGVIIGIILIVLLAGWGVISRKRDDADLKKSSESASVASVVVLKAAKGPAAEEIVLPGSVQAWHEAPIYARTSGYIKDWKTDIGARVNEGDVLADIETPEVDAQVNQAEADLATAVANNLLAQSTAKRWAALLKTNAVSRQENDEKQADARAKAALEASARANLDRLQKLEGFKRVTAPFDGTVTARNTDTGALINAGSGGGPELFHMADLHKLRIYVSVPENYTPFVTPDLTAELHFAEYPKKTFVATLGQTAHALDPATRTLLIQFVLDNADGMLMPGGFAEAHLKIPGAPSDVRIPVSSLIFRGDGMQVGLVGDDNKLTLKSITIGRDFGKEVEVVKGITPGETLVANPSDSLTDGQKVRVITQDEKNKKDAAAETKSANAKEEPAKKDDDKKDAKGGQK